MKEKALILYDGQCRLCVGSVQRIRRLDWRGLVQYGDIRDPVVVAANPDVDVKAALARMHLVRPGKPVLEGFHAFRWLAGRIPLLWGLWPLLWLPGAAFLGVRAYDTVARNRFAFGTCEQGACELPDRRAGGPTSVR